MLAYGITYGMNRILSKLAAYKFLLAVFALSFLAHITLFNFPDQAVFDEIYFGTFVRSYTTNSHFFDIHPPLGKLLIAGTAKLGGINLPADLTVIGQQYDSTALFFLRFFPLLAGIFLPVVAALIALELTKSKTAALLTGLMIVFENALLTQSRFIFLDIPMLFLELLHYLFFCGKNIQPLLPHAQNISYSSYQVFCSERVFVPSGPRLLFYFRLGLLRCIRSGKQNPSNGLQRK